MSNEEKRIIAFENKAHRRLLEINYRQMKTSKYVNETIIKMVGKFEPLLSTIKRRKMSYYRHICRHNSMEKTIMQGKVEVKESEVALKRLGVKYNYVDEKNIDELLILTKDRDGWRKCTIFASKMIPHTMHASRD